MKENIKNITLLTLLTLLTSNAYAAIALDRTRVIFNGDDKSISLNVSNENKQLPYLVQAWIEDAEGKKINSPLTIVPPLQRLEPGSKSQVKVQSIPTINSLPNDKETLFYFNMREIPPRSEKPNTLQIALQTKIKLFYRPSNLVVSESDNSIPWQEKVQLSREGKRYKLTNPTPYYVTFVDAGTNIKNSNGEFHPIMIAPNSSDYLNVSADLLGNTPVLTYINDYGGHPKLYFTCQGSVCDLKPTSH